LLRWNVGCSITDDPEKRVAVLTKHLDKASEFVKFVQGQVNAGIAGQADLLRAKSLYLDIKIKLLRERNRKRPPTPATGKRSIDEEKPVTDQRQELAELKKLVSKLSARLDKVERQLSQMEVRVEQPGGPAGMRPFGGHMTVDEFGTIWDGGRPVGTWGVDIEPIPVK